MEIKKKFVIGSRESALAVVQSRMVLAYLKEHCPELEPELLTMKTTGDKILDRRLDQIGGKGLFVKELDRALGEKRSDLSVHSLKLEKGGPQGCPGAAGGPENTGSVSSHRDLFSAENTAASGNLSGGTV